ncbi:MAG: vitamin K epoxide reductase family protein [Nitrososphaerota archaeon]|nr:vitamin K epoxide reductase family protein [Candidatus Calditenuis fumarioli]
MRGRTFALGTIAASLAGLSVSLYLLFPEQVASSPYCSINQLLSCGPVILGEHSRFLGVPVAAYGVAWFAVSSVLSLASLRSPSLMRYLVYWGALGLMGVAYLTYLEFFVIGSFCVFCTVAHLMGALVFGLALLGRASSE